MADLTIPLIGLTTLIGYYFSKDSEKKSNEKLNNIRNNIEEFDKPNGDNIYSSNKVNEVNTIMLNKSLNNYNLSENPSKSGFLPPLYNTYSIVGKDISNIPTLSSFELSKLNDANRIENPIGNKNTKDISVMPMFKSFENLTADDINESPSEIKPSNGIDSNISLLTGLPYEKTHGNMTPFFGGTSKQNTEAFSNQALLDNRTGYRSTYEAKKEVPNFGDIKQQDNVFGTPLITDQINTDRYIRSIYKTSERPFEQKRVYAEKAGTIDDVIKPSFKNIDELRPTNNPKVSYKGRIIPGQINSVRGVMPKMVKRRPDTFYEKDHDNLFRGPGAHVAPKMEEDYITDFKPSLRQEYNIEYYGPANTSILNKSSQRVCNIDNSNEINAALAQNPKRQNFDNDFVRNIGGHIKVHDYGRSGITNYEHERDTTNENDFILNVNMPNRGVVLKPQDEIRPTIRQSTEMNTQSGNIRNTKILSTNDGGITNYEAKPTQKEKLVSSSAHMGSIQMEKGMGYLVNKYEAKTTGKEIITNSSDYTPNISTTVKNGKVYSTYRDPIKVRNHIPNEYTPNLNFANEMPDRKRFDKQEKVRNPIHFNYTSNPHVNKGNSNRNQYSNLEINDSKQTLLTNQRPSGRQKFQTSSGKASFADIKHTINMELKELTDNRENMNLNTFKQTPDSSILGQRDDVEKKILVKNNRMDPNLITSQLKDNPYIIPGSIPKK